jgi:hypothetical protein
MPSRHSKSAMNQVAKLVRKKIDEKNTKRRRLSRCVVIGFLKKVGMGNQRVA